MTTHTKAKYAQRYAERMVALAKKNTLHSRQKVYAFVRGPEVASKLFGVMANRYASETAAAMRVHTGAGVVS